MKIITKKNEIIINRCNRYQSKDWKRETYDGNKRYIGLGFWYILIRPITASVHNANNKGDLE